MTAQTVVVATAAAALILTLAERVRRVFAGRPSRLDHPVVFFVLVCGLILFLRWPVIVYPQSINPDEAQMLAQAMRFGSHPVPWRDVDGTTGGPLNSLLLCLPISLGSPASWVTARIVLWEANCLTLVFLYLALRAFGTSWEAQAALIPTILFYAFSLDPNFTHYSSETPAVLLLSAGIYLLAREWQAARPSRLRLFLLGLIGGSLPFTKLQATPLGVFLVAVAFICAFSKRRPTAPSATGRWPEAVALGLGTAAMSLLILGWVWVSGAISDFWISYVLASGAYAQEVSMRERSKNLWLLFTSGYEFRPYLLSVILTAAVMLGALRARGAKLDRRLFWPLMIVLGDCVLTAICLFIAGKAFLHYLLLFLPALAVLQGLVLFAGNELLRTRSGAPSFRWALVTVALLFLPQAFEPVQYVRYLDAAYPGEPSATEYAVTSRIRDVTRAGDTMSVWGWMPSYYVNTGLAPATRDAIGHYVVSEGPYQRYFRGRYLADLERSRPAVFVDAVSDGALVWWNWRLNNRHEGFPELATYIDDNYALWWSIHLRDGNTPVRIYLLKSRMAELHLAAGNVAPYTDLYPTAKPQ